VRTESRGDLENVPDSRVWATAGSVPTGSARRPNSLIGISRPLKPRSLVTYICDFHRQRGCDLSLHGHIPVLNIRELVIGSGPSGSKPVREGERKSEGWFERAITEERICKRLRQ